MKRKMFRILLMGAMLAALVGLLACGGSDEPQAAAPEPTVAPTATSVPDTPPTAPSEAPTPTTQAVMTAPQPTAMGESCAPSADLTFDDRPPQGGTLVRLFADPPTLDPHLMGDVTSSVIGGEVFGGLVTLSLDYQPVLDLAETCSISEDGLVYTFVLRENAKFHDGKAVTAQDIKWSIERAADPNTLSPTADTYLGDIVGAKDKLEGNATEVSGVRVVDDRTVEFTIDAPKSYFLAKLTYPTAYVVDRNRSTTTEPGWSSPTAPAPSNWPPTKSAN